MWRKRYNSGSRRLSPYQVHQQSTSPQQTDYEDSLTAKCLIRMFMENGNIEDPIFQILFIGESRTRQEEMESDLVQKVYSLMGGEKGQVKRSKGKSEAEVEDKGNGNRYRSQWKVGKVVYYGCPNGYHNKELDKQIREEKRF
ncbi:unnamed protein product (macronuclear) [Paramecium tetraurelia]|uniref:Uncharacterized protein n=1 Tax=Paramecium tetraurelia TaxID=5888 RepID=A0CY66_PARTE|nr:uncharacterized protein GSPATT00039071001 [Paramecium tetraurelia]CAK75733.1 unnamed protein product [Paramecium tetraurelia]|eukprot:XP_001443130.1 hypothetical protein (macronuclear) [Paramecium tetraurelia strain d4-2]